MSTSPKKSDATPQPPDKSTVILLLSTIGDTTWRMFIPIIGATMLGVYGDNQFSMKPWLTVGGIILGTIIAAGLVRNQMKKVQRT